MKRFKDMTPTELHTERRRAMGIPFSDFPIYCQRLQGYWFYKNGRQVFKWELFDDGYDADALLSCETDVIPVKKVYE